MRTALTLAVLLGASLLAPASAGAFVLHRTGDGLPVHWAVPAVTYVVDASLDKVSDAALGAAERSFQAWMSVAGTGAPTVSLERGVADEIGYRVGEENHSTIRFLRGGSALAGDALAITVLTFDTTGTILDADIIVSGAPGRRFKVLTGDDDEASDDDGYVFDLQDVLTHEAGHSLGLAHNPDDPTVTMFPVIDPGELEKRTLAPDDEDGLRAIYPRSQELSAQAVSCAAAAGSSGSPGPWLPALSVALVAALRARSRRVKAVPGRVAAVGAGGSSAGA